jgi:hypothetical protein
MSISLTRLFRIIFELVKGEMMYVKDLENIETVSGFHIILYSITINPR